MTDKPTPTSATPWRRCSCWHRRLWHGWRGGFCALCDCPSFLLPRQRFASARRNLSTGKGLRREG